MPAELPRFFHAEGYDLSWEGHVFPGGKYRALAEAAVARGIVRPDELGAPRPAGRRELLLVHEPAYLDRLAAMAADPLQGWFEFEAPCTPEVLAGYHLMTGGTIAAARAALARRRADRGGFAANLGGGFHHAFPWKGEGFCALNDVAVAVAVLHAEDRLHRAAVLDLDVHQGNGTAVCLEGADWCFTCSLHEEDNYPIKQRSDLDFGLPTGAGDELYLETLGRALAACLDFGPELVLYVAGADPYAGDRLGGLVLSLEGLRRRDARVLEAFLGAGISVACVLGGGYAETTDEVVAIHLQTLEEGVRLDPG